MQAYEGHFENGQFYAAGRIMRIPERRRAIVNILEDEITKAKTKSQLQGEALDRLLEALDAVDDEPFDKEWDEIIARGITVDSGVNL